MKCVGDGLPCYQISEIKPLDSSSNFCFLRQNFSHQTSFSGTNQKHRTNYEGRKIDIYTLEYYSTMRKHLLEHPYNFHKMQTYTVCLLKAAMCLSILCC